MPKFCFPKPPPPPKEESPKEKEKEKEKEKPPQLTDFSPESPEKLNSKTIGELAERIDAIPKKTKANPAGLTFGQKIKLLKDTIINSFIYNAENQLDVPGLLNFLNRLRINKPEIAAKLLTDILKINQQDKHFYLSEAGKNQRHVATPAPVIICINGEADLEKLQNQTIDETQKLPAPLILEEL